jgi:DNA repair protein RecO (recombination protein O)
MNAEISTEAFILRLRDHSEIDRLVILFTKTHGKLAVLAKGARRSKVRFEGALQPFQRLEAMLKIRTNGFGLLNSVNVIETFSNIIADPQRLQTAFYILELVEVFEELENPSPDMFELLHQTFKRLQHDRSIIKTRFLFDRGFLTLTGLLPRFDVCTKCARIWPFKQSFFSFKNAGLVCERCQISENEKISSEAMAVVSGSFEENSSETPGLAEAVRLLEKHIEFQLGRQLKTTSFERQMAEFQPD